MSYQNNYGTYSERMKNTSKETSIDPHAIEIRNLIVDLSDTYRSTLADNTMRIWTKQLYEYSIEVLKAAFDKISSSVEYKFLPTLAEIKSIVNLTKSRIEKKGSSLNEKKVEAPNINSDILVILIKEFLKGNNSIPIDPSKCSCPICLDIGLLKYQRLADNKLKYDYFFKCNCPKGTNFDYPPVPHNLKSDEWFPTEIVGIKVAGSE